jgi:hypothetical protein
MTASLPLICLGSHGGGHQGSPPGDPRAAGPRQEGERGEEADGCGEDEEEQE